MENDDLLKIADNKKRDFKKILVYGAIAFLVFVIGVVSFAIYKNSTSNEAILPPEVEKREPIFKQIPVEKKEVESPVVTEDIKEDTSFENSVDNDTNIEETKKEPQKDYIETKKVKEVSSNEMTNSKIKPTKTKKVVVDKYYIQVAALLKWKEPNKKFLETIKRDGFDYRILETYTTINGEKVKVTKVLIGPFNSREEAKKSLVKVKKFISKSAFIIKVK